MKKCLVTTSTAFVLAAAFMPQIKAEDAKILVTANRIQQNVNDVLSDVVIIDRAEIEKVQPQSLIDLLVNVAGIDFVQKGGHGQDSSLFVRGANSNQLLILVDGVRVGSATLGSKSIASISMAQVEKIEIVKGARAAIWGSDAIGGVIQIFTRAYDNGEHRIGLSVGSNSTYEGEASVGFGNDSVSNTISLVKKQSQGFDVRDDASFDKDGYENLSASLRGNYQLASNHLIDWTIQSDRGENEFDTSFGGDVSFFRNRLWNLRYSAQMNDWSTQLSVGSSTDKSYTVDPTFGKSQFETQRDQVALITRGTLTKRTSVVAGIDWFQDDIGETTTTYAQQKRDTFSPHVSINYIGDQWIFDLAVRNDDVEDVATKTTLNLAAGVKLNKNQLLSLNFGQGFKAPTFNDLYYPFGGNPGLEFEESDNLELVYKLIMPLGRLSASLYTSEIENLIQWAPNQDGNWQPQNVGEAKIQGVDFNYSINTHSIKHEFTASYLQPENKQTGEQLLRRAKTSFGYQLSFSSADFDWFAQAEYAGKRQDVLETLAAYTRVNLGASYLINQHWKAQLKINDAFNEAPVTVSGYFPIEREYYLSISYQNF
ncbi:TonB-dependent receptor domain-containing protein [Aliikangiella sp. IMCC44653]